uniref:Uncharacterized protein n=1 Tax=Candidatus Kentrum sp. FM TaxID=2126340 RepID=A0A450TX35_9GAMM|nr:MAG: hypothetical protein BECKFM1743C_GA0114222_1002610 [Candidatus Kentron sp. FM]VFJ73765.1 MAG: hypothetical protein BECKFM1743A_GA0114220_107393 [Candidatus Kentron sp. FM]VFK20773.1 MAG: hypothetical protein BECKFM1743B_GA0114221_107263 [Candidatus Kentron sp. FM]
MPLITRARFPDDNFVERSVRKARSRATICDAFATESFGRPVALASKRTFPGARPSQVACQRDTNHRCDPAFVQVIPLDDDNRPPETGTGANGFREISPPDFSLASALPFTRFQDSSSRGANERIERCIRRCFQFIHDPIHRLGHFVRGMARKIFRERLGIELALGFMDLPRITLGGLKDFIREGDCCFHRTVIKARGGVYR